MQQLLNYSNQSFNGIQQFSAQLNEHEDSGCNDCCESSTNSDKENDHEEDVESVKNIKLQSGMNDSKEDDNFEMVSKTESCDKWRQCFNFKVVFTS